MQNYNIETDASGQELNRHGNSFFPLAGYDEYFSKFINGEVPWHWHEEVEIVLVISGATRVYTLNGATDLKSKEGIFVNKRVMHHMINLSEEDCHIINFVFKPELISGRIDNLLYNKYIYPVISNSSLSELKLKVSEPAELLMITEIENAFEVYQKSDYGFELSVISHLTKAWLHLSIICLKRIEKDMNLSEDFLRMDAIMKYISQNYHLKLTVKHLASVANISESECYRLFNRVLNITPIEYLNHFRLENACHQLINTTIAIIDICYNNGFGNPSYFSKIFKKAYGCTPFAYRKSKQITA